jgi:hypothetical protein
LINYYQKLSEELIKHTELIGYQMISKDVNTRKIGQNFKEALTAIAIHKKEMNILEKNHRTVEQITKIGQITTPPAFPGYAILCQHYKFSYMGRTIYVMESIEPMVCRFT